MKCPQYFSENLFRFPLISRDNRVSWVFPETWEPLYSSNPISNFQKKTGTARCHGNNVMIWIHECFKLDSKVSHYRRSDTVNSSPLHRTTSTCIWEAMIQWVSHQWHYIMTYTFKQQIIKVTVCHWSHQKMLMFVLQIWMPRNQDLWCCFIIYKIMWQTIRWWVNTRVVTPYQMHECGINDLIYLATSYHFLNPLRMCQLNPHISNVCLCPLHLDTNRFISTCR